MAESGQSLLSAACPMKELDLFKNLLSLREASLFLASVLIWEKQFEYQWTA